MAAKKKSTKKKTARKPVAKKASKKKASKKKVAQKKVTKKKASTKKASKKKPAGRKAAAKKNPAAKKVTKKPASAPKRASTKTPVFEKSHMLETSAVTRTLNVRDAGPKVRRDAMKDGGSRLMITSQIKGHEVHSKSSGEQPEDTLGKKTERKSLLGRLV